ncbi:MAG: hypothetical protein EOP05_16865 [Proteobacteria bacterium]|nr:MAG: hypothetical protein EOP05_16865 [Pseudomonadota bacterium]
MTRTFVKRAVLGMSAVVFASCAQMGSTEQLSAPEEVVMSKLDVNKYPVSKLVCDPMGEPGEDPRSNAGLKAELYWLEAGQANAKSSGDLIARGKKSDRNLFVSVLNTPTRQFDMGFNNDLGEPVKTDAGAMLIERFALRFTSVLRLAPDQEEGLYELALLSDDGATLRLRDGEGVYQSVVDNDGEHGTRFGCSSQVVELKRDTEKLMQVDYYQGPRYHIALIAMMRKVQMNADGTIKRDPSCGKTNNDSWFNTTTLAPKKDYTDLLARGWAPLKKENYALANEALFNPCKEGIDPKLSNIQVGEVFSDGFSVTWETDIPATSQLVISGGDLTQSMMTTSDNVLRRRHTVIVNGLSSGTTYDVKAHSISDTYGKTLSDSIQVRTAD